MEMVVLLLAWENSFNSFAPFFEIKNEKEFIVSESKKIRTNCWQDYQSNLIGTFSSINCLSLVSGAASVPKIFNAIA